MTIPVQYTNISPKTIVTPSSRYRNQRVIYYGEKKLLTFDTYIRVDYQPNGTEKITTITKGVEYRPDLVSQKVYGFPDNWWRILEANKMKDIWEFKVGKTIILPNRVL